MFKIATGVAIIGALAVFVGIKYLIFHADGTEEVQITRKTISLKLKTRRRFLYQAFKTSNRKSTKNIRLKVK